MQPTESNYAEVSLIDLDICGETAEE